MVCDPRSVSSMKGNPDKTALVAAGLKERKKLLDHHGQKKMASHGPGIITFDKVPAAFESTGAWGHSFIDTWKSMKVVRTTDLVWGMTRLPRKRSWPTM